MPARDQLKSAAYRVACPVCASAAGERCVLVRASGKGRWCRRVGEISYQVHPERLRAARESCVGNKQNLDPGLTW